MARSFLTNDADVEHELHIAGAVVTGLLILYWLSFLSFSSAELIHSLVGLLFVLVVPGLLLSSLLGIPRQPKGFFALYVVGLSFAILTLTTVVLSLVLTQVGIEQPLSAFALAITHTLLLLGLFGSLYSTGTRVHLPRNLFSGFSHRTVLFAFVPIIAAGAAIAMNRFGSPVGMYLLVGLLGLIVLASATRLIQPREYVAVVYTVSLSMLLHRNMVSDSVIGADIQDLYAVAEHIHLTQVWSPGLSGMTSSLPAVTAVPAAISTLIGMPIQPTFKYVFVLLFSLVPVGIYYLGRDVFDPEIALYGSLFFMFYHVSFSFTPGKQLISELFVVLLLLTLRTDSVTLARNATLGLLSLGLVFTHYGMTYAFGFSLLLGALVLLLLRKTVENFTAQLPLWQPLFLILGGSLWYAYAAPEIIFYLFSIPQSILSQTVTLFTTGSIGGSGSSYVAQQSSVVDRVTIGLYIICTVLIVLGVGKKLLDEGMRLALGDEPQDVDYSAVALPLLALLASSYFLVLNLWADRVYQLTLVVLAVFMPLGYRAISQQFARFFSDSRTGHYSASLWSFMPLLVILLLVVNSGFLAGLIGTAGTSTFNSTANDLAFSSEERAGVSWIETEANVSRTNETTTGIGADLTVDAPDRVQVFTDSTSYQLFRSELSPRFYNVEVVMLKNQWRPTLAPGAIGEGYVFIRKASIDETASTNETVPPSSLTTSEVSTLRGMGETVFENDAVEVIEINNSTSS